MSLRDRYVHDLLATCPERAELEAVLHSGHLEDFFRVHGARLSIPGAKVLLHAFGEDLPRLIGAALQHPLSEGGVGVFHANTPAAHRGTPWFQQLQTAVRQHRLARTVAKNLGQTSKLSSEALEQLLSEGAPEPFASEARATLLARQRDWEGLASRVNGASAWSDLWEAMRQQPRTQPPRSVQASLEAAMRNTVRRLRGQQDPLDLPIHTLLGPKGARNHFAVLVALGELDPYAARREGQQLGERHHSALNAARTLTLRAAMDAGAVPFLRVVPAAPPVNEPEEELESEDEESPTLEMVESWGESLSVDLDAGGYQDASFTDELRAFSDTCQAVGTEAVPSLVAVGGAVLAVYFSSPHTPQWMAVLCAGLEALAASQADLLRRMAARMDAFNDANEEPEDSFYEVIQGVVYALYDGDVSKAGALWERALPG